MPSLLDLPREIRDDILLLVITSSRPLPDTSTYRKDPKPRRRELREPNSRSWGSGESVFYEFGHPSVNATPLLLTNRQLHRETIDAVHRLGLAKTADGWFSGKSTSISYVIDVVLVCEGCLWPTWLSIPVLTNHVGTVRACIRIEKSWKTWVPDENGQLSASTRSMTNRSRYRAPMFRGGDGGPPGIVCTFYSLLERFLKYGPVGAPEDPEITFDRHIMVDVLELHFLSSSEELGLDADNKGHNMRYPQSGILRAEWLMHFLQPLMEVLLRMSYHSASFGAILYERIGEIRFFLDGKPWGESNLAQRLVCMENLDAFGHIERDKRPEYFKQWKEETLKMRRERGLPVIFPKNWVENDDDNSEAVKGQSDEAQS